MDLRGVFVCAVETPGRFWIQYLDKSDIGYNLIGFARNIKRYYNKRKNQKRHALKEVSWKNVILMMFSYINVTCGYENIVKSNAKLFSQSRYCALSMRFMTKHFKMRFNYYAKRRKAALYIYRNITVLLALFFSKNIVC